MSEPDIEKGKKRRRSARVYINANRPLAVPLSEIADAFPPDADDDQDDGNRAMKRHLSQSQRRRLAADGKALPDGSYPIETPEDLHNAAILAQSGHGDVEAARRLIARRATELNMKDPFHAADKSYLGDRAPVQAHATQRVSAPLTAGRAAASTGDHGVGAGREADIAIGHSTMRQHQAPTGFDDVLSRLRTAAGDNTYGDRSVTWTAGEAALRMFDAAGQAGRYAGMNPVNPNPLRPADHQSRGSATRPNGSHRLSYPQSHAGAPAAMKASEARGILRDAFRRQYGR